LCWAVDDAGQAQHLPGYQQRKMLPVGLPSTGDDADASRDGDRAGDGHGLGPSRVFDARGMASDWPPRPLDCADRRGSRGQHRASRRPDRSAQLASATHPGTSQTPAGDQGGASSVPGPGGVPGRGAVTGRTTNRTRSSSTPSWHASSPTTSPPVVGDPGARRPHLSRPDRQLYAATHFRRASGWRVLT
jgi:hypothetical protein